MPCAALALAGGGGGAWALVDVPAGGGGRHHCILPHLAPHPHHFAGCKRRRVWALHGECSVLGHCCSWVLGAPCFLAWRPGRRDTRCHWEGDARRLVARAKGRVDQAWSSTLCSQVSVIAKFKPNLKRLLEFVILGQFVVQQVGRCRK